MNEISEAASKRRKKMREIIQEDYDLTEESFPIESFLSPEEQAQFKAISSFISISIPVALPTAITAESFINEAIIMEVGREEGLELVNNFSDLMFGVCAGHYAMSTYKLLNELRMKLKSIEFYEVKGESERKEILKDEFKNSLLGQPGKELRKCLSVETITEKGKELSRKSRLQYSNSCKPERFKEENEEDLIELLLNKINEATRALIDASANASVTKVYLETRASRLNMLKSISKLYLEDVFKENILEKMNLT